MLSYKRHCGFLLSCLDLSIWRKQIVSQDTPASPLEKPMWQGTEASCQQPARNWVLATTDMWASHHGSRCSCPGHAFRCSPHGRPWARATQLNYFQIPDWQKLWDNRLDACHFKALSFDVFCFRAMIHTIHNRSWLGCDKKNFFNLKTKVATKAISRTLKQKLYYIYSYSECHAVWLWPSDNFSVLPFLPL